jgi:hypothetical protein
MQNGRRKPASYHAMSPKLLNCFEMVGTAVPIMVRSYKHYQSRDGHHWGRTYQSNNEENKPHCYHSWQDYLEWWVYRVISIGVVSVGTIRVFFCWGHRIENCIKFLNVKYFIEASIATIILICEI